MYWKTDGSRFDSFSFFFQSSFFHLAAFIHISFFLLLSLSQPLSTYSRLLPLLHQTPLFSALSLAPIFPPSLPLSLPWLVLTLSISICPSFVLLLLPAPSPACYRPLLPTSLLHSLLHPLCSSSLITLPVSIYSSAFSL